MGHEIIEETKDALNIKIAADLKNWLIELSSSRKIARHPEWSHAAIVESALKLLQEKLNSGDSKNGN